MSGPSESDQKNPERPDSFEERIDILFEELSLAVRWGRPSILLAFYDAEEVRETAEIALEKHLAEMEQRLVHFSVDERRFDIPRLLSRRPGRGNSVYSVVGLSRGGGKEGLNAYRALNIRREYFVDYAIRAVIWLHENEAVELSRHAPDFWAFRHRVVEFHDPIESLPRRLNLLYELASFYQTKKFYDLSMRRLKRAILLAGQSNEAEGQAKLWGKLGDIYLETDQAGGAIRAYRKAIRFYPQDGALWNNLGRTYIASGSMEAAQRVYGQAIRACPQDAKIWVNYGHFYRMERHISDAIIMYKKAVLLEPQNSSARLSLAACYRLSGAADLAEEQIRLALPMMEKENEYQRAVFQAVCGNTSQAVDLLAIALDKKQASLDEIRGDPNLDFIREDARFKALMGRQA